MNSIISSTYTQKKHALIILRVMQDDIAELRDWCTTNNYPSLAEDIKKIEKQVEDFVEGVWEA